MRELQQAINEKDFLKAKRLILDNPEYLEENVDLLLGTVKEHNELFTISERVDKRQSLMFERMNKEGGSVYHDLMEQFENFKSPPEDHQPEYFGKIVFREDTETLKKMEENLLASDKNVESMKNAISGNGDMPEHLMPVNGINQDGSPVGEKRIFSGYALKKGQMIDEHTKITDDCEIDFSRLDQSENSRSEVCFFNNVKGKFTDNPYTDAQSTQQRASTWVDKELAHEQAIKENNNPLDGFWNDELEKNGFPIRDDGGKIIAYESIHPVKYDIKIGDSPLDKATPESMNSTTNVPESKLQGLGFDKIIVDDKMPEGTILFKNDDGSLAGKIIGTDSASPERDKSSAVIKADGKIICKIDDTRINLDHLKMPPVEDEIISDILKKNDIPYYFPEISEEFKESFCSSLIESSENLKSVTNAPNKAINSPITIRNEHELSFIKILDELGSKDIHVKICKEIKTYETVGCSYEMLIQPVGDNQKIIADIIQEAFPNFYSLGFDYKDFTGKACTVKLHLR